MTHQVISLMGHVPLLVVHQRAIIIVTKLMLGASYDSITTFGAPADIQHAFNILGFTMFVELDDLKRPYHFEMVSHVAQAVDRRLHGGMLMSAVSGTRIHTEYRVSPMCTHAALLLVVSVDLYCKIGRTET